MPRSALATLDFTATERFAMLANPALQMPPWGLLAMAALALIPVHAHVMRASMETVWNALRANVIRVT